MTNRLVHKAFKNIKSIGYEFETHDLAKFVWSVPGESLINTFDSPKQKDLIRQYDQDGKSENHNIYIETTDDVLPARGYQHRPFFSELDNWNTPFCIKLLERGDVLLTMIPSKETKFYNGIEWVVTYLDVQSNKDVVKRTFLDAYRRVNDEIKYSNSDDVMVYKNNLDQSESNEVCKSKLFKSNTLIEDTFYLKTTKSDKIIIQPQMTIRCHVSHAVEIITLLIPPEKRDALNRCKVCVTLLEQHLVMSDNDQGYMTLIIYMMRQYLKFFLHNSKRPFSYYKNFLYFAPRHSVYKLIGQVNAPLLKTDRSAEGAVSIEAGLEAIEAALKDSLFYAHICPWPMHIFFKYMIMSQDAKRFTYKNKSTKSIGEAHLITTAFDIEDEDVLIEFRHIKDFLRAEHLNVNRVEDMAQVNPSLETHILNPKTRKYTKKCNEMYRDDDTFRCTKKKKIKGLSLWT